MTTTYCTFELDGLLLGIDVRQVQEVLRNQMVTPVPGGPVGLLGLLNVRGQIFTAIDGRQRLGLVDREVAGRPSTRPEPEYDPVHLILRCLGEQISFVVDAASELVEGHPDAYEDLPETINGPMRAFLTGAYKLETTLLLVLDADRVAAMTES